MQEQKTCGNVCTSAQVSHPTKCSTSSLVGEPHAETLAVRAVHFGHVVSWNYTSKAPSYLYVQTGPLGVHPSLKATAKREPSRVVHVASSRVEQSTNSISPVKDSRVERGCSWTSKHDPERNIGKHQRRTIWGGQTSRQSRVEGRHEKASLEPSIVSSTAANLRIPQEIRGVS